MPPLPSVPGVIRVIMAGRYGADNDVVNRWYIRYSGTAPNGAELATWLGTWDAAWLAHLQGDFPTAYGINTWTAEDLSSPTASFASIPSTSAGTRSGTLLPAENALILKRLIGRRYRGGHSRLYLLVGVVGDIASGTVNTWNPSFASGIVSHWGAFIAAGTASPWTGASDLTDVNVSFFQGFTNVLYPSGRYHAVPNRRSSPVVDPVYAYDVNPIFGTQRRRTLQSS